MAEARQRGDWSRTSTILALVANINRDPKKQRRAFSPDDFNPYVERKKRPAGNVDAAKAAGTVDWATMKAMFARKK